MASAVGSKALGYLFEQSADGPGNHGIIREEDRYTCQHCNYVGKKTPGPSGHLRLSWCKACMGLVCPICRALPCDPIERKIERMERGGEFFLDEDPRRRPFPRLREILREA